MEQKERDAGENFSEYSSCTSFTRRSTSSRLIFFLRCWKGDWPSIISYSRHPSAHQSGLNVYRSFFTTSGAEKGARTVSVRPYQHWDVASNSASYTFSNKYDCLLKFHHNSSNVHLDVLLTHSQVWWPTAGLLRLVTKKSQFNHLQPQTFCPATGTLQESICAEY